MQATAPRGSPRGLPIPASSPHRGPWGFSRPGEGGALLHANSLAEEGLRSLGPVLSDGRLPAPARAGAVATPL